MLNLSDKVILVDADGVLLDWSYSFNAWMKSHGYTCHDHAEYEISTAYSIDKARAEQLIRMFNESARVGFIPPLRDAMKYVKKLHEEHGYVFHCITSISNDPYAQKMRHENLTRLFGPTVFEKIVCLDTGADKDSALEPYRHTGCYWVEDKKENCDAGIRLGLTGLLMTHDHNKDYTGPGTRVNTWREVYEIVVGV